MNGILAAIVLILVLPEESLQGWKQSATTPPPPAGGATTSITTTRTAITPTPAPTCGKYTTSQPLYRELLYDA